MYWLTNTLGSLKAAQPINATYFPRQGFIFSCRAVFVRCDVFRLGHVCAAGFKRLP